MKKKMNQRIAARPPKDNLVSLLCSGQGSGKMRERCGYFQRIKHFEMGSAPHVLWNPSSREAGAPAAKWVWERSALHRHFRIKVRWEAMCHVIVLEFSLGGILGYPFFCW